MIKLKITKYNRREYIALEKMWQTSKKLKITGNNSNL